MPCSIAGLWVRKLPPPGLQQTAVLLQNLLLRRRQLQQLCWLQLHTVSLLWGPILAYDLQSLKCSEAQCSAAPFAS